jgi:hypothetical protein
LNNDKIIIDVVNDIANLTGLKMDVVSLVLDAYELVMLDKILEGQLSNDDTDYYEVGSMLIDNTNYPVVAIRAGDKLVAKIHETTHGGRDFLTEAVVAKFNSELLARYTSDSVSDHTPAILTGDLL